MIPQIVILALEFYREPMRFTGLSEAASPLPLDITELLAAPTGALSDEHIGETATRLNATVEECRACVPFFIKQVLLDAGGDYYRMLGVARAADPELIKRHYHYLMRLFHPDRDVADDNWDDLYAPRINEAYGVLRSPSKRADYDASLRQDDGFSPSGIARPTVRPVMPAHPEPVPPVNAGLSPRARWVAGGLLLAVVLGFTGVISQQSNQPVLRVDEEAMAREMTQDAALTQVPAIRDDIEIGVDDEAQLRDPYEKGGLVKEPLRDTANVREVEGRTADQRVEDIIKARVKQATVAVLGPRQPKSQSRTMPAAEPTAQYSLESDGVTAVVELASENDAPVEVANSEPGATPALTTEPVPKREPASEPEPKPGPESESTQETGAELLAVTGKSDIPQEPAAEEASTLRMQGDVAVALASRQAQPDISDEALAGLLARLAKNYETGDARAFSELFVEHARTTDAGSREEIFTMYSSFFALPEVRRMEIAEFTWDLPRGASRSGSGVARITTTPFDGGQPARGDLALRLDVTYTEAGLRITGMYYHYQ